ncbi:LytTR family DNA-binding domain-containing protein [Flagellimonas sp. DF-77]|uniref:LytR/AlgR family response regulator transcription factor n=1 Tax=Flagellimonas algarum TaxID=3230298 RepID=UPI003392278F
MELRVVIVEDEKRSIDALSQLLIEFCEEVTVLGHASTVPDAVKLIKATRPDLVFLDVELHSGTGFDVLMAFENPEFEVVFTTAFEHYALKAIKFSSIDYLLKPLGLEELQTAIEKVRKGKGNKLYLSKIKNFIENIQGGNTNEKKICLATLEGLEFFKPSEIIYCKANGAYTLFSIKNHKDVMVSKNLKEYENLLADIDFMRVHNSYLINLNEVKKYVKTQGGYIIMSNDDHVLISNSKKELFLSRMV